MRREVARVHFVHRLKVRHVGEEHRRLHDVLEAHAGRFQHRLQVLQHLVGLLGGRRPHQLPAHGIQGHLARRKIDVGVLDYKTPEKAAGQAVRQKAVIRQGIDRELARRLVKEVKDGKFKVQVSVQGDELRVSGKKRDDLQAVIQHIKGLAVEQPLQYVNFRD